MVILLLLINNLFSIKNHHVNSQNNSWGRRVSMIEWKIYITNYFIVIISISSNIGSRNADDDIIYYYISDILIQKDIYIYIYLNGKFLASTQWEEIKLRIATSDVWLIYSFEVSSFELLWSCSVNKRKD